ncbi:unnamed protein product [Rotaria socialis]|uniref:Uncharacterized protein n=1 Tax=Rotaria socialis TaxID=392032 RepID=A0A820X5X8_9BILA|nr:unnamed protein product [Rotaria socialis]CAF4528206.1 unnamed protein product [Rotaria socialis]
MQHFLLVWLDANADKDADDFQHSLAQLQATIYTLEYGSDPDQCVDYLTTIEDEKIFLIVPRGFGENTVLLIHDMPQLDTIFGFNSNAEQQPEWPKSDPQLTDLTCRIQVDLGGREWYSMGQLLLQVGHFNQAEELYNELLEIASDESDIAHIYLHIGLSKWQQDKYQEAVAFYEKELAIIRRTLPQDDPTLAHTYANISAVYNNMGDCTKAIEFYEKSNKIYEISLPTNHPDLAALYNNIGEVVYEMGYYSKALCYLENAMTIWRKSLPSTHDNIKTTMNSKDRVRKNL